jgi:hypothetical protein
MGAHNNFVAVNINVPLHQGHRFSQNVKRRSHQVHVQNFVVTYNAENALIVVTTAFRAKPNNDSLCRVGLQRAHSLTEAKHVVGVSDKLAGSW